MSSFKQLPFNLQLCLLILKLFIHISFGERLWFATTGGLIFWQPFRYPFFDCACSTNRHFEMLKSGWNINKFRDPSLVEYFDQLKACHMFVIFLFYLAVILILLLLLFFIFSSKSVLLINPEIIDSLTNFLFFVFASSILFVNYW